MRMCTRPIIGLVTCVLLTLPASLRADDFTGKFKSPNLTVEIMRANGALAGTIQLGEQKFPLKAHADGANLQGTFTSNGNDFPFNATLAGDTLTLTTGGATYSLKKDAPVNPLAAAAAPANPLAAGAVADVAGGFTVVNTTDCGKALSIQKPDAATVMAAMKATFPDLEKYFGARPNILGAYESKDHKTGSATFTVNSSGRDLKGIVSCKVNDKGAAMAIVYCNADTPTAEWAKLTADAPSAASNALPPLKEYDFPDGTGSIGLPDGWTTNAQTCMAQIHIKGPADQVINIGTCASVQTPDSPIVQMQQQLPANIRQPLLVAPYDSPVEAVKNLVPQFSELNQRAGSFAIELDNLKEQPQEVKPSLPHGKASLLTYGVTHTQDGNTSHLLGGARVEITPIGNGAWMFYMTEIAGPDKTFATDTPVMMSIINSLKENSNLIAQKTRQNIDASNQRFAQMQQAHKEQMAGYDEQNKAWERRSLDTSRRNADFDEVIRGDRTVLDTQTGTRSSVDLGNVDGIVNKLNEGDPGRYQQIPLRDEMYPLPGR